MKRTINRYQFIRAFETAGRAEQFSRDALSAIFDWMENYEDETGEDIELDVIVLSAIFDWMENYEDETGEDIELDVIAICCEWSEELPEDIAENYGIDIAEWESPEEKAERVMEHLEYHSPAAFYLDNGKIVYVQF